jgi:excinuclease ABC subunit B
MERAIGETQRRRDKQVSYNKEHGITPVGIFKDVADIMEGARVPGKRNAKGRQVAEPAANYQAEIALMTPKQLSQEIKRMEQKMFEHAKNLEFEEAAATRDRIGNLKQQVFINGN